MVVVAAAGRGTGLPLVVHANKSFLMRRKSVACEPDIFFSKAEAKASRAAAKDKHAFQCWIACPR